MTRICIASDHRGVKTKTKIIKYLTKKGYEVINLGTDSEEAVDYPIYAKKVARMVVSREADYGILLCRTGIGMSIACNRIKGARCALLTNKEDARHTRLDNDANIIAFDAELKMYNIYDILDVFLQTDFSGEERHIRRIKELDEEI